MKYRKKLIEVALPLDAINKASTRENFIYRGNPSAIHKWWAQRPLAAARAIIFAQLVDDPSSHPERFRSESEQEQERNRLFKIIEDLVLWENTTNERILEEARTEIRKSWHFTCSENKDHPDVDELFLPEKLPPFHDPFAGGGTLPLEAQRLGMKSYASDLNPVAVLINKAILEFPTRFVDRPPVNPASSESRIPIQSSWRGALGLAEDVRYYGHWLRAESERLIGHLYPKFEVTVDTLQERPDLQHYIGRRLNVIAYLWARTVKSPNPAFRHVDVPLASTFMLSTKPGKEAYVEAVIDNDKYYFKIKTGKPSDQGPTQNGTKMARGANFRCLLSGTPITGDYIKAEGNAGGMGARLLAVVAEGERGRIYLPPTPEMSEIANSASAAWEPEGVLPKDPRAFTPILYGLTRWSDLFTSRQMVALTTFSNLLPRVHEQIRSDYLATGRPIDDRGFDAGGTGAIAYADAIMTFLAFSIDKMAEYGCTLATWFTKEDRPKGLFARQALPMVWDFVETNPLSAIGGSFEASVKIVADALGGCHPSGISAEVRQKDAADSGGIRGSVISTDPPYYDNISYADLSDFFYAWLRPSLKDTFPSLFSTLATPKFQEVVAAPYRHGGKESAEAFFMRSMTQAMQCLAAQAHPAFPIAIYYAFKQSETSSDGASSTGWETFLDAVSQAGLVINGTWPIHTERERRSRGINANALASSIVLVCRPRAADAPSATRREFIAALKTELPKALAHLQASNTAPVDLAQAAIGPGMGIYMRYAEVRDAEGRALTVGQALRLIDQTLDEVLTRQEADFDPDSRWALAWFEHSGFTEGEFGVAETLSKAKNTSVSGMVDAGILASKGGKVRLLRPDELPDNWDPDHDPRLTAWEMVHQLIRVLEADGEGAAAELVAKLGSKAEIARELAYRLYTICERKRRAQEALPYNALVQSWPEITRIARASGTPAAQQERLF